MTTEPTFLDELNERVIDVPRAALRFAREIAYPELDVEAYLNQLDLLARAGGQMLSPAATTREQAELLADYLFDRVGLQGNTAEYGDPRNSYLNDVLDRGLGIPISLSVIYIAIAQRLGLPAYGIGLPGHFIVGVKDPLGSLYLDPFHGGQRLSVEDCAALVFHSTGSAEPFRSEWLGPTQPREILGRMLNNLRNVYLSQENWERAAAVVERLRLIQPEAHEYARDLAVFYHQSGSLRLAIQFYEEYLRRAPQAKDADGVRLRMQAAIQSLSRLN